MVVHGRWTIPSSLEFEQRGKGLNFRRIHAQSAKFTDGFTAFLHLVLPGRLVLGSGAIRDTPQRHATFDEARSPIAAVQHKRKTCARYNFRTLYFLFEQRPAMNSVRKTKSAASKTATLAEKAKSAVTRSTSKLRGSKSASTPGGSASANVSEVNDGAPFSLEPIYQAIRARTPAARRDEALAFAEAFYKRMEDDEFPNHTPEGWAAMSADMLEFARVRKADKASVRVFNAA
jgi:hypothetical protein